jgi:hypothetical protein
MAKVSMDILIEALFQAVLSEENKPLSVRHRRLKDRILEAEDAMRRWTKPKLSDILRRRPAPLDVKLMYCVQVPRARS